MLDKEILEKIRPGDKITFERWYLSIYDGKFTVEVRDVACRCGFTKDGHLVEGTEDYVITVEGEEINYNEILAVEFKKENRKETDDGKTL